MALYEKYGFAVQKRHFGEPLAWLVAESGDVNSYVHIWVYENAEDRNRRRAALYADPEWQSYIEKNAEAGYLLSQESQADVAGAVRADEALSAAAIIPGGRR